MFLTMPSSTIRTTLAATRFRQMGRSGRFYRLVLRDWYSLRRRFISDVVLQESREDQWNETNLGLDSQICA
jgi:hypothetical protein